MPIHYCHSCAAARGLIRKAPDGDLIGTQYQLQKYIKHTVPDPRYDVQSVFNSTSTQMYATYIVESVMAGSVEIDDRGRSNIIWCAGQPTGLLYERGVIKLPEDSVKGRPDYKHRRDPRVPHQIGACSRCDVRRLRQADRVVAPVRLVLRGRRTEEEGTR